MATTAFKGNSVQTSGDIPAVGTVAPDFTLTKSDLSDLSSDSLGGSGKTVLNIFPSIDTGVCATSVRTFNQKAAELEGAQVVCVSADLPFALSRFCGAEGITNVATASTFRSSFGADYGLTMSDGPLRGLLARAVIVADHDGTVLYTELVPEITQEPNYDAALAALS